MLSVVRFIDGMDLVKSCPSQYDPVMDIKANYDLILCVQAGD
jgi:hypothetical protein